MNIKKYFGILVLIVFVVFAIGVGVLIESKIFHASIRGRITDSEGRPVQGANIELRIACTDGRGDYFNCTTNSAGEYFLWAPAFQFILDSSVAYRGLEISSAGYVSVKVRKRVSKGANNGWDFVLTKSVDVSGRLVDPHGNPMGGCWLLLSPEQEDRQNATLTYHTFAGVTTEEDGSFRLDSVGPFRYRISREDWGGQVYRQTPIRGKYVDLSEPAVRQGLEICINDPLDYKISGHIKDAAGNPFEGTFVSITNGINIWGAYADGQGAFSIIGLDGLGKDVFDITAEGKTSLGDEFEINIPDVRLHTNDLSIVVP